jgi:hypothetical protein
LIALYSTQKAAGRSPMQVGRFIACASAEIAAMLLGMWLNSRNHALHNGGAAAARLVSPLLCGRVCAGFHAFAPSHTGSEHSVMALDKAFVACFSPVADVRVVMILRGTHVYFA